MEIELNQPLDLSKAVNSRVNFYNSQCYEYKPIVQNSVPVNNSIYRPNYNKAMPAPEYVQTRGYDNLSSCTRDADHNSSYLPTTIRSIETVDEVNIKNHSGTRKRKRYSSSGISTDYNSSVTDEDRDNVSFTKNNAKRPSLSSSNIQIKESSLFVAAKQEQALIERINGSKSLLNVYHPNMVRSYHSSDDRTPKQAEYRRKNNQASRFCRARLILIDQLQEKIAGRTHDENIKNKTVVAALNVYGNELNIILDREQIDWMVKWKRFNDTNQ